MRVFPIEQRKFKGMCVCMCACYVLQSYPTLCDPMDVACQVPLSIEFYRQEHWSGLLCLPTEDLPNPGMDPAFLSLLQRQMGSLPTTSTTWEALQGKRKCLYTCTFPWPFLGFPCGSACKESACNMGDLGSIPDWEDHLEKEKATHSSFLAWRIPWTI